MQIPFLPRGAASHARRDALLLVEAAVACDLVELCGGAVLRALRHRADSSLAWGAALHTRGNALLLAEAVVSRETRTCRIPQDAVKEQYDIHVRLHDPIVLHPSVLSLDLLPSLHTQPGASACSRSLLIRQVKVPRDVVEMQGLDAWCHGCPASQVYAEKQTAIW